MSNIISSSERRELIDLFVELEGMSKTHAKRLVGDAKPFDLKKSLLALREAKAARSTPAAVSIQPSVAPDETKRAPVRESRSKKVPYTLLLPPEQLEALKVIAERDDSSVSHHIRQAIRAYLKSRPV